MSLLNRNLTCVFAAVLACAVAPATARAESVNFNFRGDPLLSLSYGESMTFTDSTTGLAVDVTGYFQGSTTYQGSPVLVTQTGAGLGVAHNRDALGGGILLDGANAKGVSGSEALLFDFAPQTVQLNKVTFTFADVNDEFNLVVRTLTGNSSPIVLNLTPTLGQVLNYVFDLSAAGISPANRTGLSFMITTKDANDDVAIAGLSLDYTPAPASTSGGGPSVAAVPLPSVAATGLLLLGGLVMKRSRRRGWQPV
jgi:hypothetical protein